MKEWLKEKWIRFKTWVYGALVAIGIVAAPMVMAVPVNWSWTMPTQNTDGSALALSQIVETRLYCDIDPAAFTPQTNTSPASHAANLVVPGPATTGTNDLSFGRHDCFATVLAEYTDTGGNVARMESDPSNVATKIVAPPKPNPPGLD